MWRDLAAKNHTMPQSKKEFNAVIADLTRSIVRELLDAGYTKEQMYAVGLNRKIVNDTFFWWKRTPRNYETFIF